MRVINSLLIVVMSCALLACKSSDLKPDNLMSTLGFSTKDRTEDLNKPLIDIIAEDYTADTEAPKHEIDLLAIRKAGKTQANILALEAYANKVLQRLINAWPGEKVEARVFLTSDTNFGAETLENNTILLNVGTFKEALDSEDQLAAILAHELSHILAGHHRKDLLDQGAAKLADSLEIYLSIRHSQGNDVVNDYAKTQLADWFAQNILFSSWNRAQENEADILGVDLLAKAGYQPKSMAKFLDSLGKASQEKAEFVAKEWATVTEDPDAGPGAMKLGLSVETLIENAAGHMEDRYGEEYESAKERKVHVSQYIKSIHRENSRGVKYSTNEFQKALSTASIKSGLKRYEYAAKADSSLFDNNIDTAAKYGYQSLGGEQLNDPYVRYLMFRVRLAQGASDKALINLKKALGSNKASMRMYTDFASILINQQAYEEALNVLEDADEKFDKPNNILPNLILLSQKLGKKTAEYKARCMTSLNVELIQQCSAAEKS